MTAISMKWFSLFNLFVPGEHHLVEGVEEVGLRRPEVPANRIKDIGYKEYNLFSKWIT